MPQPRVTGIVLAAGSSRRLGTPKQLLPLGDTTVLGATLAVAGSCPFDQLIITVVPLDVDTWDDYERLLASVAR